MVTEVIPDQSEMRYTGVLCPPMHHNMCRLPAAKSQGQTNTHLVCRMHCCHRCTVPWFMTNGKYIVNNVAQRERSGDTGNAPAEAHVGHKQIHNRLVISVRLLAYMSVPFRVIPVFKNSLAIFLHTASRFTKR